MREPSNELSPYRLLRDPLADPYRQNSPAVGRETELDLREYWLVVRKWRMLILSLVSVAAIGTAIVTLTMSPRYTATATMQIEPQAPKVALVQEVQQVNPGSYDDKYDYYETQFEILGSRAVIARVVQGLDLANDERFADGESTGFSSWLIGALRRFVPKNTSALDADAFQDELGVPPALIQKYREMMRVRPVGNSRLVELSVTSESPQLAANAANRHLEEYIALAIKQRAEVAQRAKELLRDELGRAKERLLAAEAALNQYRKDNGIISIDGGKSDIVSERLFDLNKSFTEVQAERIRLESQYRMVQERNYESIPEVLASPVIGALKEQATSAESERVELEAQFFPGYPRLQRAIAREKQIRSRITAEIRRIAEGVESAYIAAQKRETELGRQLDQQRNAALSQKNVAAKYDTLRHEVDTARNLFTALLHRLTDVEVDRESSVSNISVFDRATVPVSPSSPRKVFDVTVATILSLALGIGLAFLLEHLDNTLRTPDEVERRLGLPTLGVIPRFDQPQMLSAEGPDFPVSTDGSPGPNLPQVTRATGDTTGSELVVASYPRSPVAEAYRTVRTGILLSSADTAPQVTLFTSGTPEEGKTVTSLNHALTLVSSGARVLVIDADLRRPRVHRVFGLTNGHGLSTYLTGQSSLEAAIHEVRRLPAKATLFNGTNGSSGHLSVLPSGPLPPNPAELLGSRRIRDTIEHLRTLFDYIVIDAPPVLPISDTVPLAPLCDAVVLVVKGQATPYRTVVKARDRLNYARANIIGVVLNNVDVQSADYDAERGYYYGHYYSDSGVVDHPGDTA